MELRSHRAFGFVSLGAGLVDAGLASLGTFLVGAYAARYLSASELGAFAVFQSALFLAAVLPAQGILLPAQAEALELPRGERLIWLSSSVRTGLPLTAAASLGVLIAAVFASSSISSETIVALTVTAGAAVIVSPLQDHVRRMMHVAEFSHRAALVSGVYCASVLLCLVILHLLEVPSPWIPLAALTIANAISMLTGIAVGRVQDAESSARSTQPGIRKLWRRGRWLVFAGGISPLATFVTVLIVTWLAGAEAMGNAEAARVVAQPIFVFGVGIASVVTPRSMEAGRERSFVSARKLRRRFVVMNLAFTMPYIALFGWDSPWNPLTEFFSTAYVVSGLVALQVVGNLMWMLTRPYQSEMVGAGAERRLSLAQLIGNIFQPITALSAIGLGAMAKPLSDLVSGIAALVANYSLAKRIYDRT